ncbi:MAG: hypothetical protein AAF391_02805 [Bacteroidota bacterium]
MITTTLNLDLLAALHALLEEVQPYQMRHTIEDLFFQYYEEGHSKLSKDQVHDIHLLVKFLNQVELVTGGRG